MMLISAIGNRLTYAVDHHFSSSVIEPGEHVALSQVSDRSAAETLKFVRSHDLEGLVAKLGSASEDA
jgi:hypothetical protein